MSDVRTREVVTSSPSTRPSQEMLIALSVGLMAFGIYLWQLSVPEFVGFYDSGVYLAATIHLVSGALPYKDFVFVNPPGLLILLSPIGALSRIFGSHDGLIIARISNSLVTAADVSLLAWLVRHRGRVAMVIAGVGLAILPVALIVSSGVRLEPYCLFLVLLGALIICSSDFGRPVISKRALILAGLLFGLAASIKLWAFFPFVAALVCLMPRHKSRVLVFVCAAAGGFAIPVLPFFLAAPHSFLSQVFGAQFLAKPNVAQATKAIWRLSDLTGFQSSSLAPNPHETVVVWLVFCSLVTAAYWRRFEHEMVDRFLLVSFVITGCALLAAPASSGYYYYFSAPFLVGVVAVSAARLGHYGRALNIQVRLSRAVYVALRLLLGVASVVLVFALTLYSTTFFTNFAWGYGMYFPWLSAIASKVPKDSCVVSDYVVFQLQTNRFAGNNAGCPDVIDPYGVWQTWNNDYANPPPAFAAQWRSYFQRANYVVLNSPSTVMIPWDRSLESWFQSNYHMISDSHGVFIYANINSAPTS